MAGLWGTEVDLGLKWEILVRWLLWAEVYPRLCSTATLATFNFEMPNLSLMWLNQVSVEQRSCSPCSAINREKAERAQCCALLSRSDGYGLTGAWGASPGVTQCFRNVHLSHSDWKWSCLTHARVNPRGDLSCSCFYFSCSVSWNAFLVLPAEGCEKPGVLVTPKCPGEPKAHISLIPLLAWLHLLSSCSACSLSAWEVCRSPVVSNRVEATVLICR